MLVRSIFDIYFSRDIVELKKVCPALAKPLCAHWCGDFTNSDVDYSFAFNNAHFSLGSAEHQLAIADQLLVRVKIGNPFPENFDFDTLVDPSARLIAYYARFYWGFWTNHTLARQSIRRIAMLAVRLKRYDILLTATFLLGHLSVIRSGSRVGYQIAAAAHFLMLRFVNRQGWINDFSKNVVFASFSYTQFVSGRIASTKIERSIEIGETLVAKSDPYYQSLLLISGLYGYAYGGNIAKTEIFSQKFQELHREGKMVRYAYVSSMMRLLPFALRGYSHLIEEEYLDLLGKFENQTSDPLIRSQFYRAAAVISLILGNNTRTLSFIVMARRERIKTRSFIAWEKFDRNIERLAKRSVPFDLAKDTLSNIAMPGKTLPHLGTILFKLMAITPVALEQGELWLEYQIKDLLCAHLGIHDVLVSRNKNQPFSSRPVIQIGNLRVEFLNIPESQILFMREVLSSLSAGVESYIRTYRKLVEARQIEKEAYLANRLKEQAEQVAHDIRSPLSALNMVMKSANSLPEEQRLIIRSATRRINDIANGLLKSSKASERIGQVNETLAQADSAPVMLVSLLDAIVSEKRIQFSENSHAEIEVMLERGYGLFATINASELSRVISNLVNNAVESFSGVGRVTVKVASRDDKSLITVTDNGCGITSEILGRLGGRGVTQGKDGTLSGSGIGIFHARATIEAAGGEFLIESQVGIGTTVTLSLPKTAAPKWFVEKIILTAESTVVSADDDHTIHQIWEGRIKSIGSVKSRIKHFAFTSLEQFMDWGSVNKEKVSQFFVDYEFAGQSGNGLDAIERAGLASKAILVTSRYEEPQLRARAAALGVRIIPKCLAPYVPVEIETPRVRYDAVLIDDDCFMQLTRNMRVQVQRNRWHAFLPRKTSSPNQKRSISRHHSTLK